MSMLRKLLGREATSVVAETADLEAVERSWNTLTTLGAGSVADVDQRGAVFPRNRPLSVEVWFGIGDRWLRGTSADGVRQSRVVGLPVVETRQRLGDADLVMTAWADEPGDTHGRVVVSLGNEADTSVVAAIVVRPFALVGEGRIEAARIAGQRIVVDGAPLIDLGREAGDSVGAIDVPSDEPELLSQLSLDGGKLVGTEAFHDPNGRACFAAMIPLTAGTTREIQIVDGREASTVAPAPLENVVAGWRSHLGAAAEIELPAWPKHLPTALMSGLLGAVSDSGRPLGDATWRSEDDTILVAALGGVGLDWAAATIAERLLERVSNGSFERRAWPQLAIGLGRIAGTSPGDEVLQRHGEAVVAVVGHSLTDARTDAATAMLLRAIHSSHGPDAAADAATIRGEMKNEEFGVELARHGVPVADQCVPAVQDVLDRGGRKTTAAIGLGMVAQASMARAFEPVVATRALAGATWRWPRHGCGDSPHARAELLVGLRALCLAERSGVASGEPAATGAPVEVDLFPGASRSWLGQSMQFSRLPTSAGLLSAAIRWHGARPALLWELTEQRGPFEIGCQRIDPSFRSSETSGETLLAEPVALSGGASS